MACVRARTASRSPAATTPLASLVVEQQAAAARAYARRGCRDCSVAATCPRCLFPAPFADEGHYCAFMREHAATPQRFRRLVETLVRLGRRGLHPPVHIDRGPPDRGWGEAIAGAFAAREAWLVRAGDVQHLFWLQDGALHDALFDGAADPSAPSTPSPPKHRAPLRRCAPPR